MPLHPQSLSQGPESMLWSKLWSVLSSKILLFCSYVFVIYNLSTILILKISTNRVSAMIESLYLQGSLIMVSILRPVTNGLRYRMRTMVPWGLGWLRCFAASTLLQRVTPPSTTFPARINLKAQVCIEFHSFGEAQRRKKKYNKTIYFMIHGGKSACSAASRTATTICSILLFTFKINFTVSLMGVVLF